MKTVRLDWRSLPGRLAHATWAAWSGEPAPVRAISGLGSAVTRWHLRRRLKGRGRPPEQPWIVSVGGLSLGGAGKTPVVLALARALSQRGVRGTVLTRGYGSRLAGPLRVSAQDTQAGDEAQLLASELAQIPGEPWVVIQSRQRSEGLQLVRTQQPVPEILLCEDAHQTAGLPRHLDVLILDRWQQRHGKVTPQTGLILPFGPYREGPEGAQRAGIWLVEVAGTVCEPWRGSTPAGPVAVIPFRRRSALPPEFQPEQCSGYAVVSGIARPEAFENACTELMGRAAALQIRCDDHCAYDAAWVARLLAAGREHGAAVWLMTAKDWVKLKQWWPVEPAAVPVVLHIEWPGAETLPDLIEERLREFRSG